MPNRRYRGYRPSYTKAIRGWVRAKLGRGVGLRHPIRTTTRAKIFVARAGYSTLRTGSRKAAFW